MRLAAVLALAAAFAATYAFSPDPVGDAMILGWLAVPVVLTVLISLLFHD